MRSVDPQLAAAQSQAFFESVLDAIGELGEGVVTLDLMSQRLLYVNDAFCRMSGYDRRSLLALPSFFNLVSPEQVPALVDELQERLSGGALASRYDVTLTRRDGSRLQIEVGVKPVGGPDSVNLLALIRDVTEQTQAIEMRQRTEERYRALVENSLFGIFQTGVNGTILSLNRSAAHILGFDDPRDVIGQTITDFYVDPHRRGEFADAMERTGEVRGFHYRIRKRDGDVVWIAVTARAIRDSRGQIYAYEGMVSDVTIDHLSRRAVEVVSTALEPRAAISQLAALIQEVTPFIQMTLTAIEGDTCRRLVSLGPRGEGLPEGETFPLTGSPQEEVVATRSPLVVRDLGTHGYPVDAKLLELGVRSYVLVPLLDEEGVAATLNVSFDTPEPAVKAVPLLSSVATSVAQGVKTILLLEDRVSAIQRLEELDKMKNDLVAIVAHDLRSPLTSMLGFSETMVARYHDMSDDMKIDLIERVARNARKLSRLVDELLAAAAIQAGVVECEAEPFDLGALVRAVCEELLSGGDQSRVTIEVAPDCPPALGDKGRTWQVVVNLVANALKYSPDDAPVAIGVRGVEGEVHVSVRDEGIGIPEADKERVFERFFRKGELAVTGVGLGLHSCRTFIEAQGGRIWVESTHRGGSTFHFTLPQPFSAN